MEIKRIILSAALGASVLNSAASCNLIKVNGTKLSDMLNNIEEAVSVGESDDALTLTDSRIPVARFDRLELNGGYDVEYTIGEPSLRICAPEAVLKDLVAFVKDGKLVVRPVKKGLKYKNVEIYISSWSLNEIVINGAADFEADGGICAENLDITVNGAGDIDIDGLKTGDVNVTLNGAGDIDITQLDCNRLTVVVNGAGDTKFRGRAKSSSFTVNGAGEVDITRLECPEVSSSTGGFGKIKR